MSSGIAIARAVELNLLIINKKRRQLCTIFDSNGSYTIFNLSTGNFTRSKEGNIFFRPISKYLYDAILFKKYINNDADYYLLTKIYVDGQIINKITSLRKLQRKKVPIYILDGRPNFKKILLSHSKCIKNCSEWCKSWVLWFLNVFCDF